MFVTKVSNESMVVIFWVLAYLAGLILLIPNRGSQVTTEGIVMCVGYLVLLTASIVVCKKRCDTSVLTYYQSQLVISAAYMTGCANISLPLVCLVLAIYHPIMTINALISFATSQRAVQRTFLHIAAAFSLGKFSAAQAIEAAGLND